MLSAIEATRHEILRLGGPRLRMTVGPRATTNTFDYSLHPAQSRWSFICVTRLQTAGSDGSSLYHNGERLIQ